MNEKINEIILNKLNNQNINKKNILNKLNNHNSNKKNILNKAIPNKVEDEIKQFMKYTVPKKYTEPIQFCNNTEKCQLTKKEICEAITQNFIVRNNIIAAILTTIPFKNENGEYEGGICYKKFLNLGSCRVCVPYDYRSLKDKDINDIIRQILEKADDLDENECRKNQGFFLKLTEKESQVRITIIVIHWNIK
jgi:hypothetical protein